MDAQDGSACTRNRIAILLCCTFALIVVSFYAIFAWYVHPAFESSLPRVSTLVWLVRSWNFENRVYRHSWIIVVIVGIVVQRVVRRSVHEPIAGANIGLIWMVAGVLLWVAGVRGRFVPWTVISLPLVVVGGAHFVLGWTRARRLILPLSLIAFVIPSSTIGRVGWELGTVSDRWARQLFINLGGHPADAAWLHRRGMFSPGPSADCLPLLVCLCVVFLMIRPRIWMEHIILPAAIVPLILSVDTIQRTIGDFVLKADPAGESVAWRFWSNGLDTLFVMGMTWLLLSILSCSVRAFRGNRTRFTPADE